MELPEFGFDATVLWETFVGVSLLIIPAMLAFGVGFEVLRTISEFLRRFVG